MTLKQKKLATNLGRARSLKEAMLMSGYSESMATKQPRLHQQKSFKEILNEYLPLEDAFVVTKDAMKAVKVDIIGHEYTDHAIRLKATDQVYKLHNVLQPDQTHVGDNITVTIQTYGESDNFRTPGLASTFRDNEQQSAIQDPQLASESP